MKATALSGSYLSTAKLNRFLSQNPTTSNLSAEDKAALFQKFLEWQKTQH